MTPEDYIKMNRGINDSKDLPRDYLEGIYSQISQKGISLKTTRSSSSKVSTIRGQPISVERCDDVIVAVNTGTVSAAQRMRAMQEMADTAKVLMEAASHLEVEFICSKRLEHVRPMFKVVMVE